MIFTPLTLKSIKIVSQYDISYACVESKDTPNTVLDRKSCGVAGYIGFLASDTGVNFLEHGYAGHKNEYHYAIKDHDFR